MAVDWGKIFWSVLKEVPWWVYVLVLLGMVARAWEMEQVSSRRARYRSRAKFASFADLIYYLLVEKKRFEKAGMTELDHMNGKQFEEYLDYLFNRLGFKVQHVGTTPGDRRGDFGADLIIDGNGKRIAVQAKNHSDLIGINAVREVIGAVDYYQCQGAMVVTNNYFTSDARTQATISHIDLWDRDKLTKVILDFKQRSAQRPAEKI